MIMEIADILEITGYAILGYDKDNKVYKHYGTVEELDKAIDKAKELAVKCYADELRRLNGESIDWIEVVSARNWDIVYWVSYEDDEDYSTSSTNGDYSPSNPWDAPGMTVEDFL
jgi:hypothetical protein